MVSSCLINLNIVPAIYVAAMFAAAASSVARNTATMGSGSAAASVGTSGVTDSKASVQGHSVEHGQRCCQ
jgi:hypothetical protein